MLSTLPRRVSRQLTLRAQHRRPLLPLIGLKMSTAANLGLKDVGLYKTKGLVNGEWIKSSSTFSVSNPANGSELAQVSEMTVDDTKEAILAAESAFKTWSKTTAKVYRALWHRTPV
ncbi:succinate semialdehyde dehydrogenase NADP+ linked [Serendipita sp. 405]|nr:succinate semialdehyde dehydrogenase NADP+ linked [Serendipita sp. 405]